MAPAQPYLAACMTYSNHASYMREWIEFHRLVGFERFFLYDNGSTDDHASVLRPYVEEGVVVVHELARARPSNTPRFAIACTATATTRAGSPSSTSTSSCFPRAGGPCPTSSPTTRSSPPWA